MSRLNKIKSTIVGFTNTITRFPLTVIFLIAAVILNAYKISTNEGEYYEELMFSFVIGASLSIVLQLLWERFSKELLLRFILMAAVLVVVLAYFLILLDTGFTNVTSVRTVVILFILLIAFFWIPSIQSKVSFNESFMAAFKAFFISLFFAAVIFFGVMLIIMAVDMLIVPINEEANLHSLNIIGLLYAPLHFLSIIPLYQKVSRTAIPSGLASEEAGSARSAGTDRPDRTEAMDKDPVRKASEASKFLEALISYVIIPITAVFTIILLLYIILNITGRFWTDNLLEPMLVSYSITVIVVYLLSSRLENVFAKNFRRIFPKVLVPIVLFQTISSILKIVELGITYGRYYVILFGVFATACGILFSILPARKNGVIAPILIAMSILSVLPPVDAFTVSRNNQAGRLKEVLVENGMLEGNGIKPASTLSAEDKQTIVSSFDYLRQMDAVDRYEWLDSYQESEDFNKVFGFYEYESPKNTYRSVYCYLIPNQAIPVKDYDFLLETGIYLEGDNQEKVSFLINGKSYALIFDEMPEDKLDLVLMEEGETEIIRASMNEVFAKYELMEGESVELTLEEATATIENEQAVLTIIAKNINISTWENGHNRQAEVYVLIRLK